MVVGVILYFFYCSIDIVIVGYKPFFHALDACTVWISAVIEEQFKY